MAIVVDCVDIKGLRRVHFNQLLSYLEIREEKGWYYGNRKQFETRHEDLKLWLEGIVDMLSNSDVIVPKKK